MVAKSVHGIRCELRAKEYERRIAELEALGRPAGGNRRRRAELVEVGEARAPELALQLGDPCLEALDHLGDRTRGTLGSCRHGTPRPKRCAKPTSASAEPRPRARGTKREPGEVAGHERQRL